MDQYPIHLELTMLVPDVYELLELLETDAEKWAWLIEILNNKLTEVGF